MLDGVDDALSILMALAAFAAFLLLIRGLDRDMSAAEGILLVVAIALFAYLTWALLRAEDL